MAAMPVAATPGTRDVVRGTQPDGRSFTNNEEGEFFDGLTEPERRDWHDYRISGIHQFSGAISSAVERIYQMVPTGFPGSADGRRRARRVTPNKQITRRLRK